MIGTTSFSDLTERLRAFEAAKKSEQLLSEMSRIAKIGGWSYDVLADKLEWTEEVYRIVEVELDYVPNVADAVKRFPASALEKIESALAKAIQEGVPYFLDLPFITEKGNWRWVRTTGFAEVENGQTTRLFGVFQDITETDRVKRDLQAFFKTSVDLLAIFDFEGHYLEMSDSWKATLGYSREDLKQIPFWDLVHPDDLESTAEAFANASEGSPVVTFENRYRHSEGHYLWLSWSSVTDLESKQIRAAARDVSDMRSLNDKLTAALHASDAANEAKSQFLAVMSHELRTPLNPILGYAQLLADEVSDSEHRKMLLQVEEGGNQLLRMIEEILNLSSIESELYSAKMDRLDFADFGKELELNFGARAREKGLDFRIEIKGDPQGSFGVDIQLLRKSIFTLIGNAIKFTDSGFVSVRLEPKGDGSSGNLQFEVKDSGIGIEEGSLVNLFEPFTQGDSSNTRRFWGVGLGLTICRKAIDLIGGSIRAESQIGKGTRFFGTLPLQPVGLGAKVSRKEPLSRIDPQTRVLIADDNDANRLILKAMLKAFGIRSDTTDNGESVNAALLTNDYDLIFMDIHFPGISGLETSLMIRSTSNIRQPYIVAVTADVINSGRSVCLRHGMDNYLGKPISKEKLNRVLNDYVDHKAFQNS